MSFKLFFIAILSFCSIVSIGQNTPRVRVEGRVKVGSSFFTRYNVMVVNKNTHKGFFIDPDGRFSIDILKEDTLLFAANGFKTAVYTVADSMDKSIFRPIIQMQRKVVYLRNVEIIPDRTLDEIRRDINEIERIHKPKTWDLVSSYGLSPITALYVAFSKVEKEKRLANKLEQQEQVNDVLKELLRKYIHADIFHLEQKEYNVFLDYCKFDVVFLQESSEYELIEAVKQRYVSYLSSKKYGSQQLLLKD